MSDAYQSSCRKDLPYPIVSNESAPSLLTNLTYALYGTINKSVVGGKIVWNIPCDPNNSTSVFGLPREEGEGLLCYILRLFASYPTPFNTVDLNSAQTLTNKTLTSPVINTPSIFSPTFSGTLVFPNNTITQAMIASGAVTPSKLSTGAPSWDINSNFSVSGGLNVSGTFTASGVINIPDSSLSGAKIGDNSILPSKLTTGAPSWNTSGDLTISGTIPTGRISNLIVSGSVSLPAESVANSATTATNGNTANAIVSRDANGAFSAGVVTSAGVTNGSNASTGNLGEWLANSLSSASAITVTNTATFYSITSITLTAGDWDVSGMGAVHLSSTTLNHARVAISTANNALTLPNGTLDGSNSFVATSNSTSQTTTLGVTDGMFPTKTTRVSVTTETPIHLVVYATFTGTAPTAYGNIEARRVR